MFLCVLCIPFIVFFFADFQEDLQRAKSSMDVAFQANRLRPGDDGFQWDVRQDFGQPTDPSGWDDDDDDDGEG